MKIEGFGNKKVYITEIEGTNDFVLVSFKHKKEEYYGIYYSNGICVINFDIKPITVFATKDHLDYCFTRENESYHFSKRNNTYFKPIKKFISNEIVKMEMVNTVNDKYWFLKIDKDHESTLSLYDVINQELITPEFNDITFDKNNDPEVLAIVEKTIIIHDSEIDEYVSVGSILAYINKDGKYVTPFYCPENDNFYDTKTLNAKDNNYRYYKRFIDGIAEALYKKYNEESLKVEEVLEVMFFNHYTKDEIMPETKPGKILEFKRSDKNES